MNYKITKCPLDGLLLLEPAVFTDSRGYFFELWNKRTFTILGLEIEFVQDNISFSKKNCIRGLHFQNPHPQAKLITVLEGLVFDVVVDLRKNSPTFGQWHSVTLSGDHIQQLFIPIGFAHGFAVLSDYAIFHYKCSDFYSRDSELTLRWDDPDLKINWPVTTPILSEKDQQGLFLRNIPPDRLFF